MTLLGATLVTLVSLGLTLSPYLVPEEYARLPIGSLQPQGYFKTELLIQADGLSGHLSLFWHDVANSSWIGGDYDTGLAERAPYWLNGMVPLSFLLKNESSVNLQKQAWKYVKYIFEHQDGNGWLGPDDLNSDGGSAYWARFNVLQSFLMYAEGDPDMFNTLTTVMLKYILNQKYNMENVYPLSSWAASRWQDFAFAVNWLLDNGGDIISGYEQDLLDVVHLAHEQGNNWEWWFERLPTVPVIPSNTSQYTHGVNNAQAFKSGAVYYRNTNNETLRKLSESRLYYMDMYHGQSTGMMGADEHLAGRMPSRGTELCCVVEYMFSFQIMFRTFGNVKYLDRLERIAMNALPATWASPEGGDMWNHQYLQQVNEINAIYCQEHVWATDGPNATIYGLAPNYGCCTANFNQGWPKFAHSVYFSKPKDNNTIGIGIYLPSLVNLPINKTIGGNGYINIKGNYPFDDEIFIDIQNSKSFDLELRIPTWAINPTLILNGQKINLGENVNGTMYKLNIPVSSNMNNSLNELYLNFNPKFRLYHGYNNSISILRGSLLFSLQIAELFTCVGTYSYSSRDYEVRPASSWNFALIIDDLNNPDKSLIRNYHGLSSNDAPFNRTNVPVDVIAQGVPVPDWVIETNAAAPPPESPACTLNSNQNNNKSLFIKQFEKWLKLNPTKTTKTQCGSATQLLLVPHGSTDLRISEFPLAYNQI